MVLARPRPRGWRRRGRGCCWGPGGWTGWDLFVAGAKAAGAAEALYHPLDVSQTASVETFMAWAKKNMAESPVPHLHVLINNAGGALGLDTVAEGKDEDWETMLQTNVLGVLRVTRAALPLLPHDDGASIINIGSSPPAPRMPERRPIARPRPGNCKSPACSGTNCSARASASAPSIRAWRKPNFPWCASRAIRNGPGSFMRHTHPLVAADIADILVWVATRPPHVNIDEMVVKPVDQADLGKVFKGR